MIRLAVCDDEQAVLDRVERFLAVYQEKAERCFSVFTFRSPSALLANIADGDDYDVYVLDIEMPELDGLTLAKAIREKQEHAVLIFLTSHNSIVITAESIKLEITRYVNKLTMEEDLPEALDVAIRKAEAQATRYLLVTHYHDVIRVPFQDILYAHRSKRLTELVLKDSSTVSDGRALAVVYQALDDQRFVYIEQGCFVNLDHVTRVKGSEVFLKNGEKLAISRNYLPKVKATIFQLLGGVR